MEMDLVQQEYTAEKYDEYILGSAQVVGLMCLHVFTSGDEEIYLSLKPAAMKLGSAFQKVNFLRDINADYYELNRTYFPGIKPTLFSTAEKQRVECEIEIDFREALIGIKALPGASKMGVYLAYVYYQKLFEKIKRTNAEKVMSERIRISNSHKCWLMMDSMLRYKMGVL
jgi:phytoene synthase